MIDIEDILLYSLDSLNTMVFSLPERLERWLRPLLISWRIKEPETIADRKAKIFWNATLIDTSRWLDPPSKGQLQRASQNLTTGRRRLSQEFLMQNDEPPNVSCRSMKDEIAGYVHFKKREPEKQQMNMQCQSTFLGKLPSEIRNIIYTMLFDGVNINMASPYDRFALCGGECPYNFKDPERLPFFSKEKHSVDSSRGLLSLPLSCKLAYCETIDHLYSRPMFRFIQAECFAHLPYFIPPQRFNNIETLEVEWDMYRPPQLFNNIKTLEVAQDMYRPKMALSPRKLPPHLFREVIWIKMWSVLASMQALRYLQVRIRRSSLLEWAAILLNQPRAESLLAPIQAVTTLSKDCFVLFVDRRILNCWKKWELVLPCSLVDIRGNW